MTLTRDELNICIHHIGASYKAIKSDKYTEEDRALFEDNLDLLIAHALGAVSS